jgi:hypothetical protein
MTQNVNFSIKKAQFWLVPILVLAGLFSWAHVPEGGQSQAQPVKTELVVSTSKSKGAKRLLCASAKRFIPVVAAATEAFTARAIQVRWATQVEIYSRIKSTITFATCYYWKSRSMTSIISG